jgi:hypothetical protein
LQGAQPKLTFNPSTGHIEIGSNIILSNNLSLTQSLDILADYFFNTRDLKNGYIWIDLKGLSFGKKPCFLSLCFFNGKLISATWNIILSNAPIVWPDKENILEELELVRTELKAQLGVQLSNKQFKFSWGYVWSYFDPKGNLASNGLRYSS